MTDAQRRALATLWPRYGIDLATAPLDLATIFGRDADTVCEIGFGNGETLMSYAAQYPDRNYLGVEVHRPGIGRVLQELEAKRLTNVRVICDDAKRLLQDFLPPQSLAAVQIFFPDPWPKLRHHKRRLVQADFLQLVARVLQPGGVLHIATDWEDYAHAMLALIDHDPAFLNHHGGGNFAHRPADRPLTKFERRGHGLGHGVWDLLFTRR